VKKSSPLGISKQKNCSIYIVCDLHGMGIDNVVEIKSKKSKGVPVTGLGVP
jgi:hypothetical protein